jgi:hypothetical protein
MDFTAIRSYISATCSKYHNQISTFIQSTEWKKSFFDTTQKIMTLWNAKSKEWAFYTLPLAAVSSALCLALAYKNRKLIGEKEQSAASVETLTREKSQIEQRVEMLIKEKDELQAFKTKVEQEQMKQKKMALDYNLFINLRQDELAKKQKTQQVQYRRYRYENPIPFYGDESIQRAEAALKGSNTTSTTSTSSTRQRSQANKSTPKALRPSSTNNCITPSDARSSKQNNARSSRLKNNKLPLVLNNADTPHSNKTQRKNIKDSTNIEDSTDPS